MTLCAYGSEPKTGSPAFFTFDDAYILGKLPNLAPWLTSWAMGLESVPQQTSEFCALEPSDDLPTAADYVKLAFPPIALLTGTYRRLGNQIRYDKWADLCQCKGNPAGTCVDLLPHNQTSWTQATFSGATLYAGNRFTATVASSCTGGYWNTPTGTGTASLTLRLWRVSTATKLAEVTATGVTKGQWNQIDFATPVTLVAGAQYVLSYSISNTDAYRYRTPETVSVSNALATGLTGVFSSSNTTLPASSGSGSIYGLDPRLCAVIPTNVVGPTEPAPPPGWPSPPAVGTCSSYQDICNAIDALRRKLDDLRHVVNISNQYTSTSYLNEISTTLIDNSDNDTVYNTTVEIGPGVLEYAAVTRGVVVEVSAWPEYLGSRQGEPDAYFDFGWITLGNADGWLRSEHLVHTPHLIVPVPAGITHVGLSIQPGVTATARFLG